jgi:hypothetical protein
MPFGEGKKRALGILESIAIPVEARKVQDQTMQITPK